MTDYQASLFITFALEALCFALEAWQPHRRQMIQDWKLQQLRELRDWTK